MLKEIISQGDFAIWPQISLVLFLSTFVGILFWVWRKGSDHHYRHMAELVIETSPADKARRSDQKEQSHE